MPQPIKRIGEIAEVPLAHVAFRALILAVALLAGTPGESRAANAFSTEAAEYFEKHIRPLLVEHCQQCHGSKKQEAGLRLDSRTSIMAGGENGPVVVPGKPEMSRLVRAIGYQDEALQMPPDGKLSGEAIARLTQWIKSGAPWPTDPSSQPEHANRSADAWKEHWAFQRVREPALPAVKDSDWVRSPIDQFVLARLEAAGLAPSPPANRRTLIRRLYIDLTGVPPAPDEVEAFVADERPNSISQLVDRLLASPQYGERWGRYWLDLARYADNKGYKFFSSDELYAYTYRDWVISALNNDLPYDQFIIQQLAADRLTSGEDTRPLAAMGFLTVGRRFLEDVHDIIDDRIDVVGRGLLGLTISCARCHDHKFDPIPTADYYSLYGVFAGSVERTRTLLGAERTSEESELLNELQAREDALDQYLEKRHKELLTAFRTQIAEYLIAARAAQKLPPTDKFMFVEEPGKLSLLIIGNWRALLDRTQRGHDPIFAPWHAMASLADGDFAAQAAPLCSKFAANADPDHPLNPRVAALFASSAPADLAEVARRYATLFTQIESEWQAAGQITSTGAALAEPPVRLPNDHDEALRRVLHGPTSPCDVPMTDVELLVGRPGQAEINELRKKISESLNAAKFRPRRAMVLEESPALCLYQPHVFVRGKPGNLGPETRRQFLGALAGPERKPFAQGSGRLELARAIADANNPLTARVLVNRVWLAHFGAGLVRTPSDFGLRSEPPSHPELLDWLAHSFAHHGWSLKQLHRLIVLSATYQQSSHDRTEAAVIDPDNRLVWRMNRRRHDLESMRDALLSVAGRLDLTPSGLPVDILAAPYSRRRTVYGFVDRQNLPGLFRVFDFAVPDAHSPQRYTTTVPQQALYLMNHPFVSEQAQHVARRADITELVEPTQRIAQLYRLLFGRSPSSEEIASGLEFLAPRDAAQPLATVAAWQYGYGEQDPATGKIKQFTKLIRFTGLRWQGGPALPDPRVGWVFVDAAGGHPGELPAFSCIRRWIAPYDASIAISGTLKHAETQGDGIDAAIISSSAGVLGRWTVQNNQAETAVDKLDVKQGDTIDFVVARRENVTCDQFLWAPAIRAITRLPGSEAQAADWNATRDFVGVSSDPWERYVHALLMTNEFVFID